MSVINFPKVPQTIKIYSKVAEGTRFIFSGKCKNKDFSFALISETKIALILEFDMEKENLVRGKSYHNGSWSYEKLAKNPIRENDFFFIQILTLQQEFAIFLEGIYLFSLEHNVPYDEINGIRLMETMELFKVQME